MPIPLLFGDSMQGQNLGLFRNEPLKGFHYTLRLGYLGPSKQTSLFDFTNFKNNFQT